MKRDIRIEILWGMATLAVDDLVRLLKASGGKVVKGELPKARRVRKQAPSE